MSEARITVSADDLDQWTEDALTQGLHPAFYILGVLHAAVSHNHDPSGVYPDCPACGTVLPPPTSPASDGSEDR